MNHVAILANITDPLRGAGAQAQQRAGSPQADKAQPVNSGANPYRVIRDWAQLQSEGRPWGGSNGVAIDRDGKSVWATDRCSPGTTPGCLGTKANPVHHFDESGKEIRSFGGGMFVWPHGIHVDRDGNVWVTDARAASAEELKKFPGEANKGSVVVKFSPEGKVLMTLGKPGVRGNPPDALTDPTDVVTDPANGDIYVAESHTDVTDPNLVGRISVFDKNGKFLRVIGKTGTGPGEFRTPHALEFDSRGRLIVADRHNHRIQILTKDGKFISEYDDFGRDQRDGHRRERRDLYGGLGVQRATSPGLAERGPDREPQGRQGDDLHSASHDAEFCRWSDGRRDCHRRRRQHLHGGSKPQGRDEVHQELASRLGGRGRHRKGRLEQSMVGVRR